MKNIALALVLAIVSLNVVACATAQESNSDAAMAAEGTSASQNTAADSLRK